MSRRPLLGPPALVASAWSFFRRQPALVPVFVWLLIVPTTLVDWLQRLRALHLLDGNDSSLGVLCTLLIVLLTIVTVWGVASTLLVGKRLIQNKAGRARTSFRTVRRDALMLMFPLVLTSLLQACFLFYRALFFLIPALFFITLNVCGTGVPLATTAAGLRQSLSGCWSFFLLVPLLLPACIYYVRTFFFEVVLVCEGLTYRCALIRSADLTRGFLVPLLLRLIATGFLLLAPGIIFGWAVEQSAPLATPIVFGLSFLVILVQEFGSVLFILATIALFGSLRKHREAHSVDA